MSDDAITARCFPSSVPQTRRKFADRTEIAKAIRQTRAQSDLLIVNRLGRANARRVHGTSITLSDRPEERERERNGRTGACALP